MNMSERFRAAESFTVDRPGDKMSVVEYDEIVVSVSHDASKFQWDSCRCEKPKFLSMGKQPVNYCSTKACTYP